MPSHLSGQKRRPPNQGLGYSGRAIGPFLYTGLELGLTDMASLDPPSNPSGSSSLFGKMHRKTNSNLQAMEEIRNLYQERPLACLWSPCNTAPWHHSKEVPRPVLPLGHPMSGGREQQQHLPLRDKLLANPKASICCRMRGSLCS